METLVGANPQFEAALRGCQGQSEPKPQNNALESSTAEITYAIVRR